MHSDIAAGAGLCLKYMQVVNSFPGDLCVSTVAGGTKYRNCLYQILWQLVEGVAY